MDIHPFTIPLSCHGLKLQFCSSNFRVAYCQFLFTTSFRLRTLSGNGRFVLLLMVLFTLLIVAIMMYFVLCFDRFLISCSY